MKKYILFDNDGVLVETEPWYFLANVEILKKMGLELTQEKYLEIMVKGQSAFILAQEHHISSTEIDKARKQRDELYQHYIQTEDIEIKGVKELISHLKKKYKMAIITSARREDFELIHATRGIYTHMDFVLCSKEYPRSKPYPDPYLKGLERFKAKKSETIIVEDSQRGLESAYAAEIDCVIVDNHFTRTHDFSKAKHFINSLEELETVL